MGRVLLLTSLTMTAFAANSILCRLALKTTPIEPATFTVIRLVSGALILFGSVQATMILYGLLRGERFTPLQTAGLLLAIAGLVALLLPGATAPHWAGAVLMTTAGIA